MRSKKGDRTWSRRVCSGGTVFKGETNLDEQRERLRPGDGKRKGGCQRQRETFWEREKVLGHGSDCLRIGSLRK